MKRLFFAGWVATLFAMSCGGSAAVAPSAPQSTPPPPVAPAAPSSGATPTLTMAVAASTEAPTEAAVEARRAHAAELTIALLRENLPWPLATPPVIKGLNSKYISPDGLRLEVKAVSGSDQPPELAVPNMCAHIMGPLKGGVWRNPPAEDASSKTERQALAKLRTDLDPAEHAVLLVGLGASHSGAARDAVVASSRHAPLGVRKCAVYLVERLSAAHYGPIGAIHIGSGAEDVDIASWRIDKLYAHDNTFKAANDPEQRACHDLDSQNATLVRQAHQTLRRAQRQSGTAVEAAGGSEQQAERIAQWCGTKHGIRPLWYERTLCTRLDSPALKPRISALQALQRSKVPIVVSGGTEAQLDAAAHWCGEQHQVTPHWYRAGSRNNNRPAG